ncbi:MAG: hypothetical protein ABSD46_08145 [Bacteroidota bacterium]
MANKEDKVVFVLGAGFSFPALGFGQSGILSQLKTNNYPGWNDISVFIDEIYGKNSNVPLEDIYTAMDRSIMLRQYIKQYSPENVLELRSTLNDLITKLVDEAPGDKQYILQFARKVCEFRWSQYKKLREAESTNSNYEDDRISILSLNWDVMLDHAFGDDMDRNSNYIDVRKGFSKKERMMFMDFCMFDFNISEDQNTIASLRLKPAGFVNLKYLKLHGAMNWFYCPNCSGIYVNMEGYSYKYLSERKDCRVCNKNFPNSQYKLIRFFVTLTFLKDFNNAHFKSIWWNAGYELAEATKVIFIGYSLPLADYEFKYLLAKNLPKDVIIQVVLSREASDFQQSRKNYSDYFGDRIKAENIYCHGVNKYVEELEFENIFDNSMQTRNRGK